MGNNQTKILEMLAAGKISVAEADRLLSLTGTEKQENKKSPKYLRVQITPLNEDNEAVGGQRVNVRVPVSLMRAGIKLASIIPPSAYNDVDAALKDKGLQIDLRDIKPENIEELITALGDLEVNVEDKNSRIQVFTEF
ncbi:MAG TPA: hypothetical protein VLH15_09025 [Dehalococcoidales bacterium]|nr:hypothetical protein [Dehalococcoidales bacterium]